MKTTAGNIANLIVQNPEICGNRPRIVNSRITVGCIATLWKQGLSAEEIQGEYPHLELAKIYSALAYYHANREEIERGLAQDRVEYEKYSQMYN